MPCRLRHAGDSSGATSDPKRDGGLPRSGHVSFYGPGFLSRLANAAVSYTERHTALAGSPLPKLNMLIQRRVALTSPKRPSLAVVQAPRHVSSGVPSRGASGRTINDGMEHLPDRPRRAPAEVLPFAIHGSTPGEDGIVPRSKARASFWA